jgi:hypothetical protein
MNFPRVALAATAAWVLYLGVSFVVHGILLADIYMQHLGAMRPESEAQGILPVGFAFALLGFFAFAYTYAKGYEGGSGMQEGLRFGVLVGLLLCCFGTIWDYMVWPMSPRLAAAWMVDYIIEFAAYGALVGAIYRPATRHARSAATAV